MCLQVKTIILRLKKRETYQCEFPLILVVISKEPAPIITLICTVTLFCTAVEVLVVRIPILVSDFRMDFAAGVCDRNKKKKIR